MFPSPVVWCLVLAACGRVPSGPSWAGNGCVGDPEASLGLHLRLVTSTAQPWRSLPSPSYSDAELLLCVDDLVTVGGQAEGEGPDGQLCASSATSAPFSSRQRL